MVWLLLLLLMMSTIIWVLILLVEVWFFGYVNFGAWAFRAKPDGRFSRWQIATQIALIGLPSMLCLWALLLCLVDFAYRLFTA